MTTQFGQIIKHWRSVRRFSQLALSAETGLSSRHISFMETGRSKPSRASVMTLARTLDMPKPIVNDALLAAGFAPEYATRPLEDAQLEPIMQAMMTILSNHEPYPAIVMDASWDIVGGNTPAMHLMQFLPMGGSMSIIEAALNDDADDPIFVNWVEIATWVLLRLQLEIGRMGEDKKLQNLYQRLSRDPRLTNTGIQALNGQDAILTTKIRIDDTVLTLFTMLAEFSSVQDLRMSERRVELFFPADDVTRAYFEGLG